MKKDILELGYNEIKKGNLYFTDELLSYLKLDIKKDGDFKIVADIQRDIKISFMNKYICSMRLPTNDKNYWINQLLEFQKNIGEFVSFGKFDSRGSFRVDNSNYISCYEGYTTAKELLNYIKGFNAAFEINQRKINTLVSEETYYKKEINNVPDIKTIKFFNDAGASTKNLNINKNSIASIIDFLQKIER